MNMPVSHAQRERKPAIAQELVCDMVRKAHGDFQGVKDLLAQEPALANAVCDWGGGDFESALGAAAHTGRAEIANYLLERGARMDIFAAAMLGRLDIVKAIVAVQPSALTAGGAHGIPLMRHAEKGGDAAAAVLAYLKEATAQRA